MTFREFKCWLEGFSESFIDGAPNKEQFERILEMLNRVEDQQTITHHFPPGVRRPFQNEFYLDTSKDVIKQSPFTSISAAQKENQNGEI